MKILLITVLLFLPTYEQACTTDTDCSDTLCCNEGNCAATSVCTGTRGYNQTCQLDSYCTSNCCFQQQCGLQESHCLNLKRTGQSCPSDSYCISGCCNLSNNTCASDLSFCLAEANRRSSGLKCGSDLWCSSNCCLIDYTCAADSGQCRHTALRGEECVYNDECQSGCCSFSDNKGVCVAYDSCHFTLTYLAFILPGVFVVYGLFVLIAGLLFRKRVRSRIFKPTLRDPFRSTTTEGIQMAENSKNLSMAESQFSKEVIGIASPGRTLFDLMSEKQDSGKKSEATSSRAQNQKELDKKIDQNIFLINTKRTWASMLKDDDPYVKKFEI